MNYEEYALIFKALSDPTRVEIIEMLSKKKLCACNILDKFNITQPTLSHHMKKLCEADLVIAEKDGKWNHYQLNKDKIDEVTIFLTGIKNVKTNVDYCKGNDNNVCH